MYELKKEISQACPAKRGHTPRKKIQKRWDTITDSKIHEFEEALGDGEGQGSLACYSPWGHQESDNNNQKSRRSNTGNSKSIPQGSGKESVQGDSSAADGKGYCSMEQCGRKRELSLSWCLWPLSSLKLNATRLGETGRSFLHLAWLPSMPCSLGQQRHLS